MQISLAHVAFTSERATHAVDGEKCWPHTLQHVCPDEQSVPSSHAMNEGPMSVPSSGIGASGSWHRQSNAAGSQTHPSGAAQRFEPHATVPLVEPPIPVREGFGRSGASAAGGFERALPDCDGGGVRAES